MYKTTLRPKNIIGKLKNSIEGFNSWLDHTEESANAKDKTVEFIQQKKQKEKKKNEDSLKDV